MNERTRLRLSWRDRRIIPRASWVAALAIPFGADDDGLSRAKLSNAQARMLRYEVLSEWHGLRDISVRWHSAVQVILPAVSLRMRSC